MALQRALQDFVLHGAGRGASARSRHHPSSALVHASPSMRMPIDARLSEGLESNFPVLAKVHGRE